MNFYPNPSLNPQGAVPAPNKKMTILVAIVVILVIVAIVYILSLKTNPQTDNNELTDAEKASMVKALEAENIQPLTDTEKANMVKALEQENIQPLTDAEKASMLEALEAGQ